MKNDKDIAICITSSNMEPPGPNILFVNEKFCEIIGYSKEELIGKSPRILQGEKTDKNTLNRMKISLANDNYFEGNIINYKKMEKNTLWYGISPQFNKKMNQKNIFLYKKKLQTNKTKKQL